MRLLKAFCIVFCLLSLISAFTGVHAVHYSYAGNVVTRQLGVDHSRLGMIVSVLNALLLAAAAYGIHTRALLAWKLGFAYLAIAYLGFIIQVLSASLRLPEGWVAAVAVGAVSSLIFLWWGLWWKRQRDYFSSNRN